MNRLATLTTLTAATAFAAALLAGAPTANAGVTRTIKTGLSCVQAYGMEGQTSHGDDGSLYNDSTSGFRTGVCPLDQATPYLLNATVAIDVYDRSYSLDVSCRIVARTTTWTSWGNPQTSSGSNQASQRLNLEIGFPEHQLANAFVFCYLPPVYQNNRSGLRGFDGSLRSLL